MHHAICASFMCTFLWNVKGKWQKGLQSLQLLKGMVVVLGKGCPVTGRVQSKISKILHNTARRRGVCAQVLNPPRLAANNMH